MQSTEGRLGLGLGLGLGLVTLGGLPPLISKDWIELLMSGNLVNGGDIGETTLAGHAL